MSTSRSRIIALISGASLFALFSCSESSEPSSEEGSVRFVYSGALSGSFLAAGPASDAFDPDRSFAVAFRSGAGELQICAYQAGKLGLGNFLLLNAGIIETVGQYKVPPGWSPGATSYQPGTFLVGVDSSRSGVEHISTFLDGKVKVNEISIRQVRGTFRIRTPLASLQAGEFDVPLTLLRDLPVICS